MKYILFSASFFCLVSVTSCSENRSISPGIESGQQTTFPVFAPAVPPAYTNPLPAGNKIITSLPGAKLNPAHGQPGHRCEIAVGAPLPVETSQAVKTVNPAATVVNPAAQAIQPIQASIGTTPTKAGLNPPHGQPGHRCDVAVGAKLPIGPAQNVAVATGSPAITPSLQNSPVIQPQVATTVAEGMNPPHGQPGHRCDIEVGKPLNSKPEKKD